MKFFIKNHIKTSIVGFFTLIVTPAFMVAGDVTLDVSKMKTPAWMAPRMLHQGVTVDPQTLQKAPAVLPACSTFMASRFMTSAMTSFFSWNKTVSGLQKVQQALSVVPKMENQQIMVTSPLVQQMNQMLSPCQIQQYFPQCLRSTQKGKLAYTLLSGVCASQQQKQQKNLSFNKVIHHKK